MGETEEAASELERVYCLHTSEDTNKLNVKPIKITKLFLQNRKKQF